MIFVYISILVLIGGLMVCARILKPSLPTTENGYSRVFLAPAAQICVWLDKVLDRKYLGSSGTSRRIKDQKLSSDLRTLYPGDSAQARMYRYRAELISTILLILAAGSAACILMSVLVTNEGVLEEGNVIYRNAYGGMDVEADLSAGMAGEAEEEEYQIDLTIPARVYSHEEADELFEGLSEAVDPLLLGDNDGPDHVIRNLRLVRSVDGYPFSISWECSNYELIDYDGVIHNEDLEEPVIVTLTADCSYLNEHWYLVRDLQVCPMELTPMELRRTEIEKAVKEADEESSSSDRLILPEQMSFGTVRWTENLSDVSPMFLMGTLVISVLMIPFRESEIRGTLKKRSRELLIDYPAFVSELTLFLGAGMSVRNCLIGMGRKAAQRKAGRSNTYLEKELIITAHELEIGISETEAVEHFGKRCGTREYMRFSALLTQNMRKGSQDLIAMLKDESEDAFTLRKNEARKLGEEASTKMLLPMVMMLAVVMIIIMVPAYMSFSQ